MGELRDFTSMMPNSLVVAGGCIFAILVTACGTRLTPVNDFQWRTLVALQAPNLEQQYEITAVRRTQMSECRHSSADTTQIRILELTVFPDYSKLPEKLSDAKPDESGVPLSLRDSGPLDLTLRGATRIVPLITGKEIIVRTKDPCTAILLKNISRTSP